MNDIYYSRLTLSVSGLFLVILPFLSRAEIVMEGTTAVFVLFLTGLALFVFRMCRSGTVRFAFPDMLLVVCVLAAAGYDFFGERGCFDALWFYEWCGLLFFYVVLRSLDNEWMLFRWVLLAGIVQAVAGVLQYQGVAVPGHLFYRLSGSFGNPGPYGGFLAAILLCGCGMAAAGKLRYGLYFLLGLPACMLLLSDSRAAWLSFGVGAVYLAYGSETAGVKSVRLYFRRRRFLYLLAVLCVVSGMLFLYFYKRDSADGRMLIWRVAFDMFADRPFFGHGIGSFAARYMYYQADYLSARPFSAAALLADNNVLAFNEFVRIACEQGIAGLLLAAGFMVSLLLCRAAQSDRLLRTAKAALVACAVFACFSYPSGVLPLKWLCVAFSAIVVNRSVHTFSFSFSLSWRRSVFLPVLFLFLLWAGGKEYVGRLEAEKLLADRKMKDLYGVLHGLYGHLSASSDFVLCYGKRLYDSGCYSGALPVLERAACLRPSSGLLTDLGDCYRRSLRPEEAEQCLLTACRMTPALILPRFALFRFYRDAGRIAEARVVAAGIAGMKVKVVNSVSLRIKNVAENFLEQEERNE